MAGDDDFTEIHTLGGETYHVKLRRDACAGTEPLRAEPPPSPAAKQNLIPVPSHRAGLKADADVGPGEFYQIQSGVWWFRARYVYFNGRDWERVGPEDEYEYAGRQYVCRDNQWYLVKPATKTLTGDYGNW